MNAQAAGTTDVNSTSLDMAGFGSVSFYAAFGTLTTGAVTSVKVQGSVDNATWSDLEGTLLAIPVGNNNKVLVTEVDAPVQRYVRLVVQRATANAVVDSVLAVQTNAGKEPVVHDLTTVVASEFHHSPAVGVA